MSNTRFEEDLTLADTQEYTVSYEGLSDNDVVLACTKLSDAERAMIIGKGESIVRYTAMLIKEDANGNKGVNLNEFLGQLWDGMRDSVRAHGRSEL